MNKELALASLKQGAIAGIVAAAAGFAWLWFSGAPLKNAIIPVIAGIAVCYAATVMLYLQGRGRG